MKKKCIWGYPWLCLCLVLPSCAVSHRGNSFHKLSKADTATYSYKLEVLLIPGNFLTGMFVGDMAFATQLLNTPQVYANGNSPLAILSLRTNDFEKVEALKEQLLATGIVERVKIIRGPNE